MNWTHLSRHEVGGWVDTVLMRSPPPIWQLAESTSQPKFEYLGASSFRLPQPRKDSGVWELYMHESEHFVRGALSESVPRAIEDAARQIDERRTYVQRELPDSHVIVAEYSSFLGSGALSVAGPRGEYEDVPVVGPGGRLTVYRTSRNGERGWLQADLVVRPTARPISSSWRPASEILRQWEIRYSETPEPLKVSAAFGYFELSKYERQTWLRPALVFDVGQPGSERSVAWQESLVLPATTSSEISLSEGLGSWAQ